MWIQLELNLGIPSASQLSCPHQRRTYSSGRPKRRKNSQSVQWPELRLLIPQCGKSDTGGRRHLISVTVTINDVGRPIGEDHRNARYTDNDVENAIGLRQQGYTYRKVSEMMDMPIRTIRDYVSGRRRCQSVAGWKKVKRWEIN